MASVEFRHVQKSFGKTTVLHDLNLQVEDGEFFVLVGPSGCGKSTALRAIAGLERVTAGDISIGGTSVIDRLPKDRNVSMVFQNYALFPYLSVYDNISFGMKMRKAPKALIGEKVQAVAELLELTPYLKRRPGELSGGQRQRVALGRAMVREPDVFLLDEPLSNLDAQLRHQMRVELARLHQRLGTTVIYVTHDQVEAMTLGHRLAVMRGGYLQQVGRPADVYRRPANKFVASFVGTMNFLNGRLVVSAGVAALQTTAGGMVPLGTAGDAVQSLPEAVELGIRPEHVRVHFTPVAGVPQAVVSLVEQVGASTLIHLEGSCGKLVAMMPELVDCEIGQPVGFSLVAEQVHWFSPTTEQRLDPDALRTVVAVAAVGGGD